MARFFRASRVRIKRNSSIYTLTINVEGLEDTYTIYIDGVEQVGNTFEFPAGTVLKNVSVSVEGYVIDPDIVETVVMNSDVVLTFTAGIDLSVIPYLDGFEGYNPKERYTRLSQGGESVLVEEIPGRWRVTNHRLDFIGYMRVPVGGEFAMKVLGNESNIVYMNPTLPWTSDTDKESYNILGYAAGLTGKSGSYGNGVDNQIEIREWGYDSVFAEHLPPTNNWLLFRRTTRNIMDIISTDGDTEILVKTMDMSTIGGGAADFMYIKHTIWDNDWLNYPQTRGCFHELNDTWPPIVNYDMDASLITATHSEYPISEILYSENGGEWLQYTEPIFVEESLPFGYYKFKIKSDGAREESPWVQSAKFDKIVIPEGRRVPLFNTLSNLVYDEGTETWSTVSETNNGGSATNSDIILPVNGSAAMYFRYTSIGDSRLLLGFDSMLNRTQGSWDIYMTYNHWYTNVIDAQIGSTGVNNVSTVNSGYEYRLVCRNYGTKRVWTIEYSVDDWVTYEMVYEYDVQLNEQTLYPKLSLQNWNKTDISDVYIEFYGNRNIDGYERITPTAPIITANDSTDILSVSHALGTTEILVSENDGAYVPYVGTINVGNVDRVAGYWKFKLKSSKDRFESPVVESPAFTISTVPRHIVTFNVTGVESYSIKINDVIISGNTIEVEEGTVLNNIEVSSIGYIFTPPIINSLTVVEDVTLNFVGEVDVSNVYMDDYVAINPDALGVTLENNNNIYRNPMTYQVSRSTNVSMPVGGELSFAITSGGTSDVGFLFNPLNEPKGFGDIYSGGEIWRLDNRSGDSWSKRGNLSAFNGYLIFKRETASTVQVYKTTDGVNLTSVLSPLTLPFNNEFLYVSIFLYPNVEMRYPQGKNVIVLETVDIPTLIHDDELDTITATHTDGEVVIWYSENDGVFQEYTTPIMVGDVDRVAGYWKFEARKGASKSGVISSEAFLKKPVEGLHNAVFQTLVNYTYNSTTNEYTPIGSGPANAAKSGTYLPVNASGAVYFNGASRNIRLGFNTTDTTGTYYNNMLLGIAVNTYQDQLYVRGGGSNNFVMRNVSGDSDYRLICRMYDGVRRWAIEFSNNEWVTYTTLYELPDTINENTVTLYPAMGSDPGTLLKNPKINISLSGNIPEIENVGLLDGNSFIDLPSLYFAESSTIPHTYISTNTGSAKFNEKIADITEDGYLAIKYIRLIDGTQSTVSFYFSPDGGTNTVGFTVAPSGYFEVLGSGTTLVRQPNADEWIILRKVGDNYTLEFTNNGTDFEVVSDFGERIGYNELLYVIPLVDSPIYYPQVYGFTIEPIIKYTLTIDSGVVSDFDVQINGSTYTSALIFDEGDVLSVSISKDGYTFTPSTHNITMDGDKNISFVGTPTAPVLTADDTLDTLSATHPLGVSEILVSENDGAYTPYIEEISVGDVDRVEGYWKFKIKSATGRDESPVVNSPAFTKSLEGFQYSETVTWGDEFDYTGTPDDTKWRLDEGNGYSGWGNNEQQYYRPENAVVEDGVLKIIAKSEVYNGFNYTSAKVNSKGNMMFQYGRLEMRAKLTNVSGMWPAFFMFGEKHKEYDYTSWPHCGEIDIMELSSNAPTQIQTHMHTGGGADVSSTTAVTDNSTAFHDYRLDWTPDYLRWFVDDVQVAEYLNDGVVTWPFDDHYNLILCLAVGGNFTGTPNASLLPQQIEIEHVRYHELIGHTTQYVEDKYSVTPIPDRYAVIKTLSETSTLTCTNPQVGVSVNWYLYGQPMATGNSWDFTPVILGQNVPEGIYTVTLEFVEDSTGLVSEIVDISVHIVGDGVDTDVMEGFTAFNPDTLGVLTTSGDNIYYNNSGSSKTGLSEVLLPVGGELGFRLTSDYTGEFDVGFLVYNQNINIGQGPIYSNEDIWGLNTTTGSESWTGKRGDVPAFNGWLIWKRETPTDLQLYTTIDGINMTPVLPVFTVPYTDDFLNVSIFLYNNSHMKDPQGRGLFTRGGIDTPTITADDILDTITATHTDENVDIYYSVDNGPWTLYTEPLSVVNMNLADGYYKFEARSTNELSNIVESPEFTIRAIEGKSDLVMSHFSNMAYDNTTKVYSRVNLNVDGRAAVSNNILPVNASAAIYFKGNTKNCNVGFIYQDTANFISDNIIFRLEIDSPYQGGIYFYRKVDGSYSRNKIADKVTENDYRVVCRMESGVREWRVEESADGWISYNILYQMPDAYNDTNMYPEISVRSGHTDETFMENPQYEVYANVNIERLDPHSPTINEDDILDTLEAINNDEDGDMYMSFNDGTPTLFEGGIINIGNFNIPAGRYKFHTTKNGINSTVVANSPFTRILLEGKRDLLFSHISTVILYDELTKTYTGTADGGNLRQANTFVPQGGSGAIYWQGDAHDFYIGFHDDEIGVSRGNGHIACVFQGYNSTIAFFDETGTITQSFPSIIVENDYRLICRSVSEGVREWKLETSDDNWSTYTTVFTYPLTEDIEVYPFISTDNNPSSASNLQIEVYGSQNIGVI